MEELERNPPVITTEVPTLASWVVGEQRSGLLASLPSKVRGMESGSSFCPLHVHLSSRVCWLSHGPQLCRRRMFSKTVLLLWHQQALPKEPLHWSQGCLSTCRTSYCVCHTTGASPPCQLHPALPGGRAMQGLESTRETSTKGENYIFAGKKRVPMMWGDVWRDIWVGEKLVVRGCLLGTAGLKELCPKPPCYRGAGGSIWAQQPSRPVKWWSADIGEATVLQKWHFRE